VGINIFLSDFYFFLSVRRGHRASRRKLSIPKASGQQSWSQTMRTLVKNGFNKATTLSKRSGKDIQRQQQQQQQAIKSTNPLAASSRTIYAETGGPSVVQLTKSSARRLPSAETEASGTGSSQTWEDYGTLLYLYGDFYYLLRNVCVHIPAPKPPANYFN
jgi:hypothetical protein